MILLLYRCGCFVVARTARATIATEAAAIAVAAPETAAFAIAAESAIAVATETAATVVAITVAVGLAHHRRGAFLVLVDTNGEIADHVFADPLLPLDLGDRRRRAVDVDQHEIGFAILVHPVGEGTYAPVFHLHDLAAELLDNSGHLGGQFFDLLGARILTREKNMLIKRHGCPFQCWRGSRRQALRTLRKGLDMLRRRKHGTTDRLALPHQNRR